MNTISVIKLILVASSLCLGGSVAAPNEFRLHDKVFNYQGSLPIKDDRTNEVTSTDTNPPGNAVTPSGDQSASEAACWKLINEQSVVTFALQRRVLDELKNDMKNLTMDENLRKAIEKIDGRLRDNMDAALEGLKRDAADEFFDALFDTSEDIIAMSTLLREPKLEDDVFLTLVKAVSRLGRNNSILIQEFTDMCSFVNRSPRPRVSISIVGL